MRRSTSGQILSMFDLRAPIIPGKSAAGVRLGQMVAEIAREEMPFSRTQLDDCTLWDFEHVRLWSKDGQVVQIGVGAGYKGLLDEVVGVGSTIAEVERHLGPVEEDEADTLVVVGASGWCFETEAWNGSDLESNRAAKVTEIFVFNSDA